jgi:hypothetical protein
MILHERAEWIDGYAVAAGEGEAWWSAPQFDTARVSNITWHYPGGTSRTDPVAEVRGMHADYHRRTDAGDNGRPAPFSHGYNLGYNAVIDRQGGIWKVRWFDQRCAANGADTNANSFAIQFMLDGVDADITDAQLQSGRQMDKIVRERCPGIPAGVDGHRGHSDFVATPCPGEHIRNRMHAGELLHVDNRRGGRGFKIKEEDEDMKFINMGTFATFSDGGSGYVHWINSPEAADLIGVPPPKRDGTRGTIMPSSYFQTLVLIGPMPHNDRRKWSAADFSAHKPQG